MSKLLIRDPHPKTWDKLRIAARNGFCEIEIEDGQPTFVVVTDTHMNRIYANGLNPRSVLGLPPKTER